MFTRIALLLLVAFATAAQAQDNGWFEVTKSPDGDTTYAFKLHTSQHTQDTKGVPITAVVGRIVHNAANKIEIVQFYVTDADCIKGYGNLVLTDINGNLKGAAPFADGGGNIAGDIAGLVCTASNHYRSKAAEETGES